MTFSATYLFCLQKILKIVLISNAFWRYQLWVRNALFISYSIFDLGHSVVMDQVKNSFGLTLTIDFGFWFHVFEIFQQGEKRMVEFFSLLKQCMNRILIDIVSYFILQGCSENADLCGYAKITQKCVSRMARSCNSAVTKE